MTAFTIVVAFILGGKYIFELFGITIPAFKITGGILIFYVGFEMYLYSNKFDCLLFSCENHETVNND